MSRPRVTLLAITVLLLLSGWSKQSAAYPQYVGRGEFVCQDCHYSPTGGGLLNAWGRQSREVTFGPGDPLGFSPDEWWGHDDATGRGSNGKPQLEADVGADVRLLSLIQPEAQVIPMLVELGAVLAWGDVTAYGTVSYRKGTPGTPLLAQPREYWLQYRFGSQLSARVGRMTLPFGLRLPDHTQYTREDLGFDKWDQHHALSLDWVREELTLSAAGFSGDLLLQDPELRESGVALRGTYVLAGRAELGLSGLLASSSTTSRRAASASLRWNPASTAYLLAEVGWEGKDASQGDASLSTVTTYGRAGYFVLPELDVFAEGGTRTVRNVDFLDRSRVGLGANWQAWHVLELIPQAHVETAQGLGTQLVAMVQLHLMY